MACLVWIVLISLLFKAFGHGGGNLPLPTGVSMERSIILSDSARLTVAPGELPGYTGWARPEATLAGAFQVQPTSTTVVLTTLPTPWNATFSCRRDNPELAALCMAVRPWFYVRAYGPSVLTGIVTSTETPGQYTVSLAFMDAGLYTVEVVMTFSNPPSIDTYPQSTSSTNDMYEGYMVSGFPLLVQVVEDSTRTPKKDAKSQPPCTIHHLTDQTFVAPLFKARWQLVDANRHASHVSLSQPQTVNLDGYQRSSHSLGLQFRYTYTDCQWEPRAYATTDCRAHSNLHVILIGDSTMRLQRDAFHQLIRIDSHPTVRVTFLELYGGIWRCLRQTGPDVLAFLQQQRQQSTATNTLDKERVAVVWNSGLHDIHRLCGSEFAAERATYLTAEEQRMPCAQVYARALQVVAEALSVFKADVTLFQTTTAGWPKYGNYGMAWDPTHGQPWPLDAAFIDYFNQNVAWNVLQPYMSRMNMYIVDGYWVSLARPDHREVDNKSSIGKKLSHPGRDIILVLVRTWWDLIVQSLCK
jgi:hypothetical protein